MMRIASSPLLLLLSIILASSPSQLVSASIFLPGGATRSLAVDLGRPSSPSSSGTDDAIFHRHRTLGYRSALNKRNGRSADVVGRHPLAMAIPGNGVAEQVVIGGFGNFIAIYNTVITARILLSWFPAAAGVGVLQPVYQITDPYLNLFRGIIPPIFGLDLSPILAFVTLNLLQSSTATLAAEIPQDLREKMKMGKRKLGGFGVGQ
eukprot:CAMPEP_0172550506 /NCGR_PEP_ID=MMETSP1067-20121228/30012_1 /TAXON_ID=265564 ORGANISM="Thalassiosira punctigera, Strain Tpunct2005C2" /NCGR_SAMPLE_ID=MMETSP1067 /ASSEMBLY_ACC=CAM_ASM_000444 /LENGTH=205 /DNA_ID=CAMNT_0013338105 /DNA_START=66 /DNA_END=683 /DNA_ORIENTATION=+